MSLHTYKIAHTEWGINFAFIVVSCEYSNSYWGHVSASLQVPKTCIESITYSCTYYDMLHVNSQKIMNTSSLFL